MALPSWLARLVGLPSKGGEAQRPRLKLATTPDVLYAIGDVHGCLAQLQDVERQIVADAASLAGDKLIVVLGDLVDRGPNSAEVLDHLLRRPPAGFRRICLAGNHDDMMLAFLDAPRRHMDWLEFGGDATLRSYGVDVEALRLLSDTRMKSVLAAHVPNEHKALLAGLPALVATPDYVFAHAGVRPGVAIDAQADADLLWYRDGFEADFAEFAQLVVHGHIPVADPHISPHRIGIDTGAYATGRLTAVRLTANKPPLLLATKRAGRVIG
ncbi:MAG TPA: metallophosphoesterase family protein [Devosia sp.]|nr:metallophosphoesterase family protein [Devosia sp.]